MAATLISPPALEPVSLAEAKAHLRVDSAEEDGIISALITTARVSVEHLAGVALVTQRWAVLLDAWPDAGTVELPLAPIASVDVVRVYDEDDQAQIVDPARYFADLASRPARLVRRGSEPLPAPGRVAHGIEIEVTAGFGSDPTEVPETLRRAMLMLCGHWFENRAAVEDTNKLQQVPLGVHALLAPYRRVRL